MNPGLEHARDVLGNVYPRFVTDLAAQQRWDFSVFIAVSEMWPATDVFPETLVFPRAHGFFVAPVETGAEEEIESTLTAVRRAGGPVQFLRDQAKHAT